MRSLTILGGSSRAAVTLAARARLHYLTMIFVLVAVSAIASRVPNPSAQWGNSYGSSDQGSLPWATKDELQQDILLASSVPARSSNSGVEINSTAAAAGASQGWLEEALNEIRTREYWFSTQQDDWVAYNRQNRLKAVFGASGYRLISTANGQEEQIAEVRFGGVGRGTRLESKKFSNTAVASHLERRAVGITEWFENRPEGLEQGWILQERPAGDGALTLRLDVSGAMARSIGVGTESAVEIKSKHGRSLHFASLTVLDTKGQVVGSRLKVDQGSVVIEVADRDSAYPLKVDPVWTDAPDATLTGPAQNSFFGVSVASAGDVNGDGYADLIIGASGANSNHGSAFLYLGSASGLSSTPSQTFHGDPSVASNFGSSVASAGDVNGDGYADAIIGADGTTNPNTGSAYLYLGSAAGLSSTPSQAFTGFSATKVASAGDVNGDGYADVVIGAEGANSGTGSAYLYLGSAAGLSSTPSQTFTGSVTAGLFGHSVASAGDVNGDGYADVIIGAWGTNSNTGSAYLYLGSASGLPATPSQTFTGPSTGSVFGASVASAGDVNGDGYADAIIGADGTNSNTGNAYLYLGSASGLSSTPSQTFTGPSTGSVFGASVASAGDVNGDGYADVVIGAPGTTSNTGDVYLYLGSASGLSSTPSQTFPGPSTGSFFGASVASAGDVNGDGYTDVFIGADGTNSNTGNAYLYLGSASDVSSTPSQTLTGSTTFGNSVTSAGDVNGDGYADVIIGEPGLGRAYLYLGSASGLPATPSQTFTGPPSTYPSFGVSVASAGDVNGDGYADVIIGADGMNNTGTNFDTGTAYLYLGSTSGLSSTPSQTFTGPSADSAFGHSVASAGDVNGDGYADVIIGAYGSYSSYLYLGSASGLSSTPSQTFTSPTPGDFFGVSVASAGDVNGDGYADVIIGAEETNNYVGAAYLYLGSASGLSATPSQTFTGPSGGQFGYSVASAGDVNGDGYADVIIGAPYANSNTGNAYLYLGSASSLSSTPSQTFTGASTGSFFGASVASAGDVNGDGYADVIIGHDFGYLYLGSASGLFSTPSQTLTTPSGTGFNPASVASAGDVNGDGYADVIIGSGSDSAAYLYPGNGSLGRDLHPNQRLSSDTAPIIYGGMSDQEAMARLSAKPVVPFGCAQVKMQWEVEPLGTLFSGLSSIGTSSATLNTCPGASGYSGATAGFDELITGLAAATQYHWRIRYSYSGASVPPGQSKSRWFTLANDGWQTARFRTLTPPVAAMPVFSPPAGTYTSNQSVSISDSSSGVTIYYTTDGSTPTTSSTVYSGAITVSATQTIKAIASGGNFSGSSVASATYTINPPAAPSSGGGGSLGVAVLWLFATAGVLRRIRTRTSKSTYAAKPYKTFKKANEYAAKVFRKLPTVVLPES